MVTKKLPRMYTTSDDAMEQMRNADQSEVESEDPMEGEDYVKHDTLLTGKLAAGKVPMPKKKAKK